MDQQNEEEILKKAEICCDIRKHYRGTLEKMKVCKSCPMCKDCPEINTLYKVRSCP